MSVKEAFGNGVDDAISRGGIAAFFDDIIPDAAEFGARLQLGVKADCKFHCGIEVAKEGSNCRLTSLVTKIRS